MEQVLKFEQLVFQYEQAAGKELTEDLKVAVVLKSLPPAIKNYVSVLTEEDIDYSKLREVLMKWERSQQKWTGQVSTHGGAFSQDSQNTDMEVDKIYGDWKGGKKGKGKGKFDSKGKGKDQKGKGKGFGGGKGPPFFKGKGKFDSKGKGKDGKKGKQSWFPDGRKGGMVCYSCGKPGHMQKDCWSKSRDPNVKQVAEGSDDGRGPGSYAGTSSTVPSSAQAMMNNVQPGARNVKRIFFLGDEDNPELEEFQISNVTTGDESWCRAISRKRCACLSCAIDPYSTDAVSDDDWFSHLSSEVAYSDPAIHDELSVEIFSEGDEDLKEIKPVYESYDLTMDDQAGSQVWEDPCSDMLQIEIGLDSGADISVMPFSFESYGSETFSGGVTRLRDAQGNLMKHGKTKRVTLDCGDSTLVENFTMCSVATPLLALGKMIRQGWNFQKEDHSLFLVKDGAQIPVKVRGNALSISAHVKRVQADFWTMEGTTLKRVHNVARCSKFSPIDSGCPFSVECLEPTRHTFRNSSEGEEVDSWQNGEEQDEHAGWTGYTVFHLREEATVSRIVVSLNGFDYEEMAPGWNLLDIGVPAHRGLGARFFDPTESFPMGDWPYRSTFVKLSGKWILLEWCESLSTMRTRTAEIQGATEYTKRLTLLHMGFDAPESLKVILVEDELESIQMPKGIDLGVLPDPFLDEEQKKLEPEDPERVQPEDQPEGGDRPRLEMRAVGETVVNVDGIALTENSGSAALRTACKTLGVGASGSKKMLFKRLQTACAKRDLMNEAALAEAARPEERQPEVSEEVKEPSLRDRTLHELTHTPFQKWCEICVSVKSRRDRRTPIFQEAVEPKQVVLVCLDRMTGMSRAIPLPTKEATFYAAKEVCAFIAYLGHSTVSLKSDNEQAMLSLQQKVARARGKHGFKTFLVNSQLYDHETNGAVERMIQSIRNGSTVLLEQVRNRTGETIGVSHPLFAWSFVHASFVQNHYSVQAGTTAFERCFGIQYYGRLCNFGESVLAAISPAHHKKGNVKFVKMTWVGKTLNNNMNICLGPHGAYLSRSVRRLVNPACWDVPLIKQVTGYPWSYGLGQIGTKLVPGLKQREPQSESIFMGILPPVHADASGLRNQLLDDESASDPESLPADVPTKAGHDPIPTENVPSNVPSRSRSARSSDGKVPAEQPQTVVRVQPPASAAVAKRENDGSETKSHVKFQRGDVPAYERGPAGGDESPGKEGKNSDGGGE